MGKRKKEEQTTKPAVAGRLDETRELLRKQFGDDAIKTYDRAYNIPTVPTGALALDKALGGGLPQGRMIEFLGEASSGKSTLTLSTIASAQKLFPNKHCVYVDVEHTLDTVWAEKLGIDFARFEHCQPTIAEDAIYMMEGYLQTGETSVIALDSVAALIPKKELVGDFGEANIGLQARMVSQTMRRLNSLLLKHPETLLIYINQKRARIGGGSMSFGFEPTKSTGGKALPFYMTTRISLVKIETIKNSNEKEIGQVVKADVLKHKISTGPGHRVTFDIDNSIGIDQASDLLVWGLQKKLVTQGGSWFTFSDGNKVQGETAAKEYIREQLAVKWKEEFLEE